MDQSLGDRVCNRLNMNICLVAAPQDETLFSQQIGECVPQRKYEEGIGRFPPAKVNQGLVPFFLEDGSFLPVCKALRKDYAGLVFRDESALPDAGELVNILFEWPGCPSQVYPLRIIDWCRPPNKIPVSALATEVAKLVKKFLGNIQGKPIDPKHARWKVGPGGIQIDHLRLASLEQVSAVSWKVRVFYKHN